MSGKKKKKKKKEKKKKEKKKKKKKHFINFKIRPDSDLSMPDPDSKIPLSMDTSPEEWQLINRIRENKI